MQNVTILGLTLQERTLPETMTLTRRFITNGAIDVMAYVDHDVLSKASKDKQVKEFILNATVTLWENVKLLKLVGITGRERLEEVGNRIFLKKLFELIASESGTVIIAAADEKALDQLENEVAAFASDVKIVHKTVMELNSVRIPEDEINSINAYAPLLLIARADYRLQNEWLKLAKSMINVGIWLALPPGMNLATADAKKDYLFKRIWHKVSFRLFKRRAAKAMEGQNDL